MSKRDDILGAIRCCRKDRCEQCPLQQTICDELHVEMTEMPTELVDMIDEELRGNDALNELEVYDDSD